MSFGEYQEIERRKDRLHTLQMMGRAIAVEFKVVGIEADDQIGYHGRVPKQGWMNQLFGRTTIGWIRVDGWSGGGALVDAKPILLSDGGVIYVKGAGLGSSTEGSPLSERHVSSINSARAIQKSLHMIEERYNLFEKLRAGSGLE